MVLKKLKKCDGVKKIEYNWMSHRHDLVWERARQHIYIVSIYLATQTGAPFIYEFFLWLHIEMGQKPPRLWDRNVKSVPIL